MIKKETKESLIEYLEAAKTEFNNFIEFIKWEQYEEPVNIILESQKNGGRLHLSGIGKPSYVAGYMASLISSTGTPAYILHGTEAVHGSCGQLKAGDVVICISNSGETSELKATATAIKNNGCKVIAVTGNPDSWLAKMADAHIYAGVSHEGGPLNRAPRISILAEILALQGLSIILQSNRGLTPQEYVLRHPGGCLGVLRDHEK